MIFHIAVCSPDPVLRGRVQRHCMEYYARRADACIVEQLESTAALLQQEEAGSRYELYLIELPAANPCSGLQAAAELRRRGVRAPLAFLAHTTAYAYEAFRVDAMQYLHIPFRPEQLTALLDRATEPEYGPVIPAVTIPSIHSSLCCCCRCSWYNSFCNLSWLNSLSRIPVLILFSILSLIVLSFCLV